MMASALVVPVSSNAVAAKKMALSPAPLSQLVAAANIPYEQFTLDNGLTVLVHEDRKAPIVAVSIWYNVGSKHEPKGKTGYAHLFEHIMFNGSQHAPGDFFEYLKQVGATDFNGTTWLDRTNYFQTVPRAALNSALFLESDRMGYLLGGLTQEKLDNQIGVVQNEKRQGDNQPYGLVEYQQTEMLFPADHPYGHTTIGSMADLQAATLNDMRGWFTGHYGPNNAVLVLAGDLNAAEARPLVEKWFGAIPSGPKVADMSPALPSLDAPRKAVMRDRVPVTRIYRNWVIPGLRDEDHMALDVAATVLGGLASSRLDNVLVKKEQSAVAVYAYSQPFVHAGNFEIGVDVKPGMDADVVAARLDSLMAEFIATGPTEDEVRRVATREAARLISGLEQVGGFSGKAVTLAEGALYMGDPAFYRKQLQMLVDMTPARVQAAMQKWLTRPVAEIRVVPGERDEYGKDGTSAPAAATPAAGGSERSVQQVAAAQQPANAARTKFPGAGPSANIDFPDVETATLRNGIKVYFARRSAVPVVRVAISFDAGQASDPAGGEGTNALMTAMMDEGTTSLDSVALAETEERLGAAMDASSDLDRTVASVRAMKPNLAPSLALLADYVRNPAFDAKELERVRVQQLTRIDSEMSEPSGIARRTLPALIYGADHPYGRTGTGLGTAESVGRLTRDDLAAYHRRWISPKNAEIFAVGDTSLSELLPLLDAEFGKWKADRSALPVKPIDIAPPASTGRVVVIDRPNSPQSYILAGAALQTTGKDDLLMLQAANDIMGGDFLSRINMDLRETKGWSYGSRSSINQPLGHGAFVVRAPVQTDKTGPAVLAIRQQIADFVTSKGVTPAELHRIVNGKRLELAGQYEQGGAILGRMQTDRLLGRPFDYVEGLASRFSAMSADALGQAMRAAIDPSKLTWVIVGDAAKIRPQLEGLDMPVEYRAMADSKSGAGAVKSQQGE